MIINTPNLRSLYVGFRTAYQGAFDQAESMVDRIATTVPSNTETEEYGWLGQLPGMRKWIGDRHVHGLSAHGYSIKNDPFELTIGVPRTKIEDDTYGVYSPMFQEMGRATRAHPDELVARAYKLAREAEGYDKVPFFSTQHKVLNEKGNPVNVSNVDDNGGGTLYWYVLDTSRALKPVIFQNRKAPNFVGLQNESDENVFWRNEYVYGVDARNNVGYGFWQMAQSSNKALDAANLKAAITALGKRKGDYGRPLGLRATTLLVPAELEFAAAELIAAQRNAAGADNVLFNRLKVEVNPWLD